MKIGFSNFWPDFQKEFDLGLVPLPFQWIKELEQVEVVNPEQADVVIYSGFGHKELPKHGKIKIQLSFESWYLKTELFDINLIPKEGENCIPLSFIHQFVDFHKERYQDRKLIQPSLFCCFVVSNPNCMIRNQVFQLISQNYKPILSYGKVFNNTDEKSPGQYYSNEYLDWMKKFKFCLCFENSKNDYYITEKIFNAYLAGCIPIYWGTLKCKTILNPKAFLYLEEETLEGVLKLIEKIKELDNNEELYQQMRNEKLFNEESYDYFDSTKKNFQSLFLNLKTQKMN